MSDSSGCRCPEDESWICSNCIVASEPQMSRGYNSFSGVDIRGVFNMSVVEELQQVAYHVTRVTAPLFNIRTGEARFPHPNPEVDKYLKHMRIEYERN